MDISTKKLQGMSLGGTISARGHSDHAKKRIAPRIKLPESDYYDLVPLEGEGGTVQGAYYKPKDAIYPHDMNSDWVIWDFANTHGLFDKDETDSNLSFGHHFNLVPLMFNQAEHNWIMRRDNGQFWNVYDYGNSYSLFRIHEPQGEAFFKMLAVYYQQNPPYDYFPYWICLIGEEVTGSNFKEYLQREREGKTKPITKYGSPPDYYFSEASK